MNGKTTKLLRKAAKLATRNKPSSYESKYKELKKDYKNTDSSEREYTKKTIVKTLNQFSDQ